MYGLERLSEMSKTKRRKKSLIIIFVNCSMTVTATKKKVTATTQENTSTKQNNVDILYKI